MVKRQRGYSLLEVVVTLAVFGVLLLIITVVSTEMRRAEKKWPVSFMKHPHIQAVIARLRKDVVDAFPPYYVDEIGRYTQGDKILILHTLQENGTSQWVVWDFTTKGEVRRRIFTGGVERPSWHAGGIFLDFSFGAFEFPGRPYGIRLKALDEKGVLAVDMILQPRATVAPPEESEGEEEGEGEEEEETEEEFPPETETTETTETEGEEVETPTP